MAAHRRKLQFSLRGLLALLSLIAIGLGWKVERARQRGRAVDAIIAANGAVVYYSDEAGPPSTLSAVGRDHFWDDLNGTPVGIRVPVGLEATLGHVAERIDAVRDVTLISHGAMSSSQLEAALQGWRRRFPDAKFAVHHLGENDFDMPP